MTDTSTEAVEAFIQSTMKEAVLSEGMPRTPEDTQDAYATVTLLRDLTAERDAQAARIAELEEMALQYLLDAGQWCDLTADRDALRQALLYMVNHAGQLERDEGIFWEATEIARAALDRGLGNLPKTAL